MCNASNSLRPLQPLRPPCNCKCCRALNPALVIASLQVRHRRLSSYESYIGLSTSFIDTRSVDNRHSSNFTAILLRQSQSASASPPNLICHLECHLLYCSTTDTSASVVCGIRRLAIPRRSRGPHRRPLPMTSYRVVVYDVTPTSQ